MLRKLLVFAGVARTARCFLEGVRRDGGLYQLEQWPQVRRRRSLFGRNVNFSVARLRWAQRLTMGFLDPVEDALFLTAGLRRMGIPASFHLGREIAPSMAPAGVYAWTQCGNAVVSTSLPVQEEYVEIHRSGDGGAVC